MPIPTPASTEATTPEGTATADGLVARVQRELGQQVVVDRHSNDPTTGTTTFTVPSDATERYGPGMRVSWPVGSSGNYETAIVSSVTNSTTLELLRAQDGTAAVDHAANAVFHVEPDHSNQAVYDAVVGALEGLWPRLFSVQSSTYTAATDTWYALDAAAEDVLDVYQTDGTPPERTRTIFWDFPRLVDSDFATSKRAVKIRGISTAITNFYVLWTKRLVLTTLTTVQQELVVQLAALRLLEQRVIRQDRQTESFVFDATNKVNVLRQSVNRLIDAERARLDAYLPTRHRILVSHGRQRTEGL